MESLVRVELSWEKRCRATSTEMGLLQPQWGQQSHLHQPQQPSWLPSTFNSRDSSFAVWVFPQIPFPLWFILPGPGKHGGAGWEETAGVGWLYGVGCCWLKGGSRQAAFRRGAGWDEEEMWREMYLHKILIRYFWQMRSDHLLRLTITVLCCQLPEFLQSSLGIISVQQTMHHYMV